MLKSIRTEATLAVLILLTCAAMAAAQTAQPAAPVPTGPMQWMASMRSMDTGASTYVTVHADSFSPPALVDALKNMLKDKGQDTVVGQLNAMPQIGWIRIGSQPGYPLPVIRYITTDTGYRIVAVCGRPISPAGQMTKGIITTQYPIGAIILNINKEGKNEGQLLPAVKFEFNEEGTFDPQVYGTAPLRLFQIKEEKAK
jgi:hypothetical protein